MFSKIWLRKMAAENPRRNDEIFYYLFRFLNEGLKRLIELQTGSISARYQCRMRKVRSLTSITGARLCRGPNAWGAGTTGNKQFSVRSTSIL